MKVKLTDACPHWELDFFGVKLRKNDGYAEVSDSYELQEAIQRGFVEVEGSGSGEKEVKSGSAVKEGEEVWVFAQQREGKVSKVVLELLGKGRELADTLGVKLTAVLLNTTKNGAEELIAYGADKVYAAVSSEFENYNTNPYAHVISELAEKHKPQIVLYGATHIGRDLAPRVASRLKTGLTADCTELDIDKDSKLLLMTRPAFGGNLMATIACEKHKPQMSTVRPGVMKALCKDESRKGEIVDVNVNIPAEEKNTEVKKVVKSLKKLVNLEESELIVSIGRGVGSKENIQVVKDFADMLGAELGASRAVVDAGWIEHEHQIGQTGKTVKPKVYIACGISGAIQHVAGMQNSDCVIAINKDQNAMIFKCADIGIVGDLNQVIPMLIEELKKE